MIDSVRPAGLSCDTTAANPPASDDSVALVREGASWRIGALSGG